MMNSYSDKTSGKTFQSAADSLARQNRSSSGLFLKDNRTKFAIQTKGVVESDDIGQPVQLKSDVKNTPQTYHYDGETVTVGKKMEAWLDPEEILQGESANLN